MDPKGQLWIHAFLYIHVWVIHSSSKQAWSMIVTAFLKNSLTSFKKILDENTPCWVQLFVNWSSMLSNNCRYFCWYSDESGLVSPSLAPFVTISLALLQSPWVTLQVWSYITECCKNANIRLIIWSLWNVFERDLFMSRANLFLFHQTHCPS